MVVTYLLFFTYFGPNGGSADDPFALDGSQSSDGGISSTTMLLTLLLILMATLYYQMSKNTKKKNQETLICKPMNTENNDRHFDPPPID
jgi:hypothetical protein